MTYVHLTPYGSQEGILGGAASYCSLAASYFTQPRMVGVIGNDFGDEYLDRLRKRGIDLEGVQKKTNPVRPFSEREIP